MHHSVMCFHIPFLIEIELFTHKLKNKKQIDSIICKQYKKFIHCVYDKYVIIAWKWWTSVNPGWPFPIDLAGYVYYIFDDVIVFVTILFSITINISLATEIALFFVGTYCPNIQCL